MALTESEWRLDRLLGVWRDDPGGTYRSWFLWEERLKNFRSIRRGLQEVVAEIRADTFGTLYRGSSLETVVKSIAEQRQMFKGADHAFLWKPKLRIPDIYENRENQLAFAAFLDSCACCSTEAQLLRHIAALDARNIKGVGPAAANLLYFLHPTLAMPFNTAIVKGYNLLTGSSVKLGRWPDYLAMRLGALRLTATYADLLSNDLGAVAALLFDVGSGRYQPPPVADDAGALVRWETDLAAVRNAAGAEARSEEKDDHTHTEIQGWLRNVGFGLGYDVWIASNDRSRLFEGSRLDSGCLGELPPLPEGDAGDAIRLIDVVWLTKTDRTVVAAFEVEHTTSIYSGIMRMLDLMLSARGAGLKDIFLVAPDAREKDVRAQLARPAFRAMQDLSVQYLPYSALAAHRDSIIRFGEGLKAIRAISRTLT
jgi:type II restriction enzyme